MRSDTLKSLVLEQLTAQLNSLGTLGPLPPLGTLRPYLTAEPRLAAPRYSAAVCRWLAAQHGAIAADATLLRQLRREFPSLLSVACPALAPPAAPSAPAPVAAAAAALPLVRRMDSATVTASQAAIASADALLSIPVEDIASGGPQQPAVCAASRSSSRPRGEEAAFEQFLERAAKKIRLESATADAGALCSSSSSSAANGALPLAAAAQPPTQPPPPAAAATMEAPFQNRYQAAALGSLQRQRLAIGVVGAATGAAPAGRRVPLLYQMLGAGYNTCPAPSSVAVPVRAATAAPEAAQTFTHASRDGSVASPAPPTAGQEVVAQQVAVAVVASSALPLAPSTVANRGGSTAGAAKSAPSSIAAGKSGGSSSGKREKWSKADTDYFIALVRTHRRSWARIEQLAAAEGPLLKRSQIDLKDKWRNLVKANAVEDV